MRAKDILIILILLPLLFYFIPKLTIFYLICGYLDFRRSHRFTSINWRRYFLGNGIFTWFLSPFNLLVDLFSHRNKGIFKLHDLPVPFQAEIQKLMQIAENNKQLIISELSSKMEQKKRGMMFFKWYGKNVDTSLQIPFFNQDFKYIKTIGVSVFNQNQSTSIHYGPLRLSLRVLYNLVPMHDENIYIDVANQRHYWHENSLFIFDDTLVHQSVNKSDNLRYCMFIDIMRPTNYLLILNFLLSSVRGIIVYFNRIFYKNWDFLK